MKIHSWLACFANSLLLVGTAWSQAGPPPSDIGKLQMRIEELEQKVKILERKEELSGEAAVEKAKVTPVTSIGASGFSFRSADSNFVVRLRGNIQADARFFLNDAAGNVNDTFLLRRVRPSLEGTLWEKFDFRIMPDFAPATHSLQDAYVNLRFAPQAQLQLGKFKSPFSLERLVSQTDLLFIERGLPINLAPNRDVGVQLHGKLLGDKLEYAIGAFNGTSDGGSSVSDGDEGKELAARVFARPFASSNSTWLQGFGLGVAGTFGDQTGSSLGRYVSGGQQTFFNYRTGVLADGEHWRFGPQGYYYKGPFGAFWEYTISSQPVAFGATTAEINNQAWQVAFSYVLTGEDATHRGVTPAKPFNFAEGSLGAFQLALRYGELSVDGDVFPALANPTVVADRASALGFGLNWFLNRNVKAVLNYEWTRFNGGTASAVTSQDEHALLSRIQLNF